MNFDQTYIQVYCDLEFIIDTIYFNNMSVQTGGGGGHTFSSENTVLVFFLFSQKIGFDISCKLYAKETVCINVKANFLKKIRKIFQNVVC